jgi:hypothetical protein
MAERELYEALNDCIDRMNAGARVEDCLRDYPELAGRLRPLLETGDLVYRAQQFEADSAADQEQVRPVVVQAMQRKAKRASAISRTRWVIRLRLVAAVMLRCLALLRSRALCPVDRQRVLEYLSGLERTGAARRQRTRRARRCPCSTRRRCQPCSCCPRSAHAAIGHRDSDRTLPSSAVSNRDNAAAKPHRSAGVCRADGDGARQSAPATLTAPATEVAGENRLRATSVALMSPAPVTPASAEPTIVAMLQPHHAAPAQIVLTPIGVQVIRSRPGDRRQRQMGRLPDVPQLSSAVQLQRPGRGRDG